MYTWTFRKTYCGKLLADYADIAFTTVVTVGSIVFDAITYVKLHTANKKIVNSGFTDEQGVREKNRRRHLESRLFLQVGLSQYDHWRSVKC
ncbi:hypothetical protein AB6A40_001592 [Gnathostoma spinigerum]|uniref:7TM GPCR serpentine receptor class x (Srx) domain-containing protein n=1 Tax=Gnathostoma spinigerum TaxID=75299 RepID=A0ABD6E4P0_9BILA